MDRSEFVVRKGHVPYLGPVRKGYKLDPSAVSLPLSETREVPIELDRLIMAERKCGARKAWEDQQERTA